MNDETRPSPRPGRWLPILILVAIAVVVGWTAQRQKASHREARDVARQQIDAPASSPPDSPSGSPPAPPALDSRSPDELHAEVLAEVDLQLILGGVTPDLYPQRLGAAARAAVQSWTRTGAEPSEPTDTEVTRVRKRGEMALVAGDFERALADFRAVYAANPDDEACVRVGRLLGLTDRLQETEEFFRQALAEHPDFHRSRRELAQVYGATERLPEAARLYESHLEAYPNDGVARCEYALHAQLRLGQVDAAIASLKTASRQAVGPVAILNDVLEKSLVELARVLGPMQRPQDAIDLMRTTLRDHPDMLEVRRELVLLLRRFGSAEEATKVYREVLDAGDDPGVRILLASDVLLFTGKIDEAKAELEAAYDEGRFDPGLTGDLDRALAMLAGGYAHLDRLPELIPFYQQLLQATPAFAEVRQTLARVHLELKDAESAISLYREYLEQNPTDAHARTRLAMSILSRLERFEEAEADLRRARRDDPRNGPIAADLALFLYQRDRIEEAIEVMREAIDLAPSNRLCVERFIELLDLGGRSAEANPWRQYHQQLILSGSR